MLLNNEVTISKYCTVAKKQKKCTVSIIIHNQQLKTYSSR